MVRLDSIALFSFGRGYEETSALREACLRTHLRVMDKLGRVYTVRSTEDLPSRSGLKSSTGQLLAIAICFSPGHDPEDVPDSAEQTALLAMLPPEQREFRNQVSHLEATGSAHF